MRLNVLALNIPMSDSVRELAERRLLFALSRFSSRIDYVSLTLSDVNGPRGGADKVCRATVKLRRLGTIVVTDEDAHVEVCVARIAERIGRTVARTLDKGKRFDRRRLAAVVDQEEPTELNE